MIRTIGAGAIYFALVFAAGFAMGLFRLPILVPRFGERIAELIEAPFMIVVILLAARWLVKRFAMARETLRPIQTGIFAAILLLTVEFSVVLWIRGISLSEFFAERDPIAAAAYYIMVALFAVAPLIFARIPGRS